MRKLVFLVSIMILFVASSQTYGQEEAPADAALKNRMDALEEIVKANAKLLQNILVKVTNEEGNKDDPPQANDKGAGLDNRIEELQKKHDALVETINEKAGKLGPAGAEIKELAEQLGEKIAIDRQLNEKIDKATEGIRQTLVDHGRSLSDHGKEINEAASRALRDHGQFVITNKMATDQSIWVNHDLYRIQAGKTRRLENIPVGTVSTRLPNEKLMNWTLGAPSYEEKIEIVPAPFRIHPIQPDSVWRQEWRWEFVDGMGWQWVKVLVRRL